MKKTIILLTAVITSTWAFGQSFGNAQVNPFNIVPTGFTSNYHFTSIGDLDGDGDNDLLVSDFDGKFHYYENLGTNISPNFATGTLNPFGITGISFPVCGCNQAPQVFVDIDDDGDLDLFAVSWYKAAYLFAENIGNSTAPQFAAFTEAFSWNPGPFIYPSNPGIAFVDIDADGDLDFFTGQQGSFKYAENTGTAQIPSYLSLTANPFSLLLTGDYIFPSFADIDKDGDQDLFVGNTNVTQGDIKYFKNSGSSTAPNFEALVLNPFGFSNSSTRVASLAFADMNNDGHLDAFAGGKLGTGNQINFYENTGAASSVFENSMSESQIFPNPANDRLTIQFAESKEREISIINSLGVLVYVMKTTSQSPVIDVSILASGIYQVMITQNGSLDNSETIKRIVIQD